MTNSSRPWTQSFHVLDVLFASTVTCFVMLLASCPSTGAGMIHRDAIRPSVDAVTEKFDELVVESVGRGEMHPIEGDTWRGESALLRHLVSGSTEPVAVPAPMGAPDPPE